MSVRQGRFLKRIPWVLLISVVLLSGCAARTHYVGGPRTPSRKLLLLPEGRKGKSFEPYVVNGETYYPLPEAQGFRETGIASWYGKKFHGRRTASGEIFDMYRKSAAHKILPLGTHVLVTNLRNGKKIVVRINDRGPFVKGRVIDLSYAAAKAIGLVGPGTAPVRVVALGKEVGKLRTGHGVRPVVRVEDLTRGSFAVQVGAFRDRENALRVADRLTVLFDDVEVSEFRDNDGKILYRVRVFRSGQVRRAREIEKRLEDMGFEEAFVVRL